ncbi:MAG: tetratricopeptide repeat protein [Candidatus Omnitrophica bacterium]|nr:tetratricopeptide repeat protein [Candidatus Omnitrophota bacterium]
MPGYSGIAGYIRFSRLIYVHILKKLKKEDIYRVKSPDLNQNKYSNNAVKLDPQDDLAYVRLGRVYKGQMKYPEAELAFKKAIELNPKNDSAYVELGWLYKDRRRLSDAEQAFKKAIELNPENYSAYIGLGQFYRDQGKIMESEQAFKKAIENSKEDERVYGGLATLYGEMGKDELSKAYAEKADKLRDKFYNPVTVNNYHKLKQILDKRKIKLVCVQYPMRSIQPLKNIFKDDENIIFVDNERIFKDAVRKDRYDEYFRDIFGGDFGHCTHKGNRLLAQNIANAILKEIFSK